MPFSGAQLPCPVPNPGYEGLSEMGWTEMGQDEIRAEAIELEAGLCALSSHVGSLRSESDPSSNSSTLLTGETSPLPETSCYRDKLYASLGLGCYCRPASRNSTPKIVVITLSSKTCEGKMKSSVSKRRAVMFPRLHVCC